MDKYMKSLKDAVNEYFRERYRNDPEYRARKLAYGAAFRKRNPTYYRDYMRALRKAKREARA